MSGQTNTLYYGDNLSILREQLDSGSVDLIYLDPPFNSNASYDVLFPTVGGDNSSPSVPAFDDLWQWTADSESAYEDIVGCGERQIADLTRTLRNFLGDGQAMAHLVMMTIRLLEMRRVLKESGTIYLHCDPTAGHYLRLIMDAVFGQQNFLNEIIWHYEGPQSPSRTRFATKHDILLRYARRRESVDVCRDGLYREITLTEDEARREGYKRDDEGRWYYDTPTGDYTEQSIARLEKEGRIRRTSSGTPRVKYYLKQDSEGSIVRRKKLADVWNDIPSLGLAASARENLGYPTQKPEKLLRRIILADSREGQLVMDPFCGSGTTLAAAESTGRRWIGTDSSQLALTLTRHRLAADFGRSLTPYRIAGNPETVREARALAQRDARQFQLWAMGLVNARPQGETEDSHLFGVLNLPRQENGVCEQVVVMINHEQAHAHDMESVRAVMADNDASIGILITLHQPSQDLIDEMGIQGTEHRPVLDGCTSASIRVISIESLLQGEDIVGLPTLS